MSERLEELRVELEKLIAAKLEEIQAFVSDDESQRRGYALYVQFADERIEFDVYNSGGIHVDTDHWQGSSC